MSMNGQFSFGKRGEYSDSVSGQGAVLAAIDTEQFYSYGGRADFYCDAPAFLVSCQRKDTVRLGIALPQNR